MYHGFMLSIFSIKSITAMHLSKFPFQVTLNCIHTHADTCTHKHSNVRSRDCSVVEWQTGDQKVLGGGGEGGG